MGTNWKLCGSVVLSQEGLTHTKKPPFCLMWFQDTINSDQTTRHLPSDSDSNIAEQNISYTCRVLSLKVRNQLGKLCFASPLRHMEGRVTCIQGERAHYGGQGLALQIPAPSVRGWLLHVLNLWFPIRQIGAGAPFDTRGLVLLQILGGQLAASQENLFQLP